ncbi:MAG: YabP/YqfC family sporulation protein [Clostridia bacterium]|jgi:sporulation protein YabP|nr:YabP/YqfC family sporulation protein [Clostridia bacterium]
MVKTEKSVKVQKEHSITLSNRAEMTLSGVCEVMSFSDTSVMLKTCCGDLLIRGNSLNIGRLNTETGELYISGTITFMRYDKSKKKGGVFEGLFK